MPLVKGFGIETHFIRVDGRIGPSGGSKAEHMVRHLAELALAGVDPVRTVVIGDAADDAVAARHVGAGAVLHTGGSHSRASLEGSGCRWWTRWGGRGRGGAVGGVRVAVR